MRLTEPVVSIAAVIILLLGSAAALPAIARSQTTKPTTQPSLDCVNLPMWQRHYGYYI